MSRYNQGQHLGESVCRLTMLFFGACVYKLCSMWPWVDEVQLACVSTLVSLAFGPLKFVIIRFPGHIMSVCRGDEMN